jgi:hypothetical protein
MSVEAVSNFGCTPITHSFRKSIATLIDDEGLSAGSTTAVPDMRGL